MLTIFYIDILLANLFFFAIQTQFLNSFGPPSHPGVFCFKLCLACVKHIVSPSFLLFP